jgi:hypothetical protein
MTDPRSDARRDVGEPAGEAVPGDAVTQQRDRDGTELQERDRRGRGRRGIRAVGDRRRDAPQLALAGVADDLEVVSLVERGLRLDADGAGGVAVAGSARLAANAGDEDAASLAAALIADPSGSAVTDLADHGVAFVLLGTEPASLSPAGSVPSRTNATPWSARSVTALPEGS